MVAHQVANNVTPTFWMLAADAPRARVVVPHMLALPPDCAAFCAGMWCTPVELFQHITETLSQSELDPRHYALAPDWCCAAAQPGTRPNATQLGVLRNACHNGLHGPPSQMGPQPPRHYPTAGKF